MYQRRRMMIMRANRTNVNERHSTTIVSNSSTSMCWGNCKQITVTTTTQKYRLNTMIIAMEMLLLLLLIQSNALQLNWIERFSQHSAYIYAFFFKSLLWMIANALFSVNHAKDSAVHLRFSNAKINNDSTVSHFFSCNIFFAVFLTYDFILIGIIH